MAAKFVKASSQYLKTASATVMGGATNITLMAWVKRLSSPGSGYDCVWAINNRASFYARSSTSGDFPYTVFTATQFGAVSGTPIPAGVWTHVVMRRSAGNTRMFYNGVLQADLVSSDATAIADDILTVGTSVPTGGSYLDGLVFDFACFPGALTNVECAKPFTLRATVAQLMASGGISSVNPSHNYPLDQVSGNITNGDIGIADLGVDGINLIVGGGTPTWVNDSPFAGARATTRPDGSRPYFDRPHYARIWRPPLA